MIRESHVGEDGRADLPLLEPGCFTPQVQEMGKSCAEDRNLSNMLYLASIWVIPIIVAITFHEAAHGFVAHLFGDETAWRLGRVSFNPLKHIDPVGTILLPGFLLMLHSPFMFGYAKPVPVNFRALRNPDMIWVAAAGPTMNIALAILAALAFHLIDYLPGTAAPWAQRISRTH